MGCRTRTRSHNCYQIFNLLSSSYTHLHHNAKLSAFCAEGVVNLMFMKQNSNRLRLWISLPFSKTGTAAHVESLPYFTVINRTDTFASGPLKQCFSTKPYHQRLVNYLDHPQSDQQKCLVAHWLRNTILKGILYSTGVSLNANSHKAILKSPVE